ncbi:hypothetical protein [Luteimonas sp. e5]
MKAPRDFKVTPPDSRLVGLVVGSVVLVLAWMLLRATRDGATATWVALATGLLVTALLLTAVNRRRVTLADGELRIVAGFNRSSVPVSELLLHEARIVNLHEHAEYAPGWLRVNGTSMPGYSAGHFINRAGRRSFALLTDRERVLVLPRRDGRQLLLSLEQPRALLQALTAAVD